MKLRGVGWFDLARRWFCGPLKVQRKMAIDVNDKTPLKTARTTQAGSPTEPAPRQAPAPAPSAPAPRAAAWASVGLGSLQRCVGVLTDIDDTLTCEGSIQAEALVALHQLQRASVPVMAITGRPLGWSLPFAKAWPVDAIVAENGAVMLKRFANPSLGRHANAAADVQVSFSQDEATRAHHAAKLREVAQRIVTEVPGAKLAQDSAGRATDIAIDHSEFAQLGDGAIRRVVALMQQAGMTATVSSIHINGWFGTHSKWTGAQWAVAECTGRQLVDEVAHWLYVGDSTNDQVMFQRLPMSVGVANLMRFADALHAWPAYITQGERGHGFAQVASALLAARTTPR